VTVSELTVDLGDRSYPVLVGPGVRDRLATVLPTSAARVAIVTQPEIPVRLDPHREHRVFHIGQGEQWKTLATVEELCRSFAAWGMTRDDVVVGCGGGMVTDVAGFAGAIYHRGVRVVHVPTTLLAMVDAAIGGKTGVNLPEGKNLVGAFWQPSAVLCDLDVLASLSTRDTRCGLGEMAKYHFLTGDELLDLDIGTRIARCVEIKAGIVADDEREGGRRALLNYGHTLAHALEIVSGHRLAHGEAVAIGLVYAAHLAHELGRIDTDRVEHHRHVVEDVYGLDTTIPEGLDDRELLIAMSRDKKTRSGLTFVLDGPTGVDVVHDVPAAAAVKALGCMTRADNGR
jgi:5-deoxy-5-amino-3-dehydroquinate synthase